MNGNLFRESYVAHVDTNKCSFKLENRGVTGNETK